MPEAAPENPLSTADTEILISDLKKVNEELLKKTMGLYKKHVEVAKENEELRNVKDDLEKELDDLLAGLVAFIHANPRAVEDPTVMAVLQELGYHPAVSALLQNLRI